MKDLNFKINFLIFLIGCLSTTIGIHSCTSTIKRSDLEDKIDNVQYSVDSLLNECECE